MIEGDLTIPTYSNITLLYSCISAPSQKKMFLNAKPEKNASSSDLLFETFSSAKAP